MTFDGSGSLVQVPDASSLDLSTGMTLEAWVFPTAGDGWRDVIYKGGSSDTYYLEGSSDAGPPAVGGAWGGTLYGSAALPLNTWTHVAGTYDGVVDAPLRERGPGGDRPASGSIPNSSGPLTIGGDLAYGQNFQGRIDDVRIYRTALTQAEIQTDMNNPVTPSPTVPKLVITAPAQGRPSPAARPTWTYTTTGNLTGSTTSTSRSTTNPS